MNKIKPYRLRDTYVMQVMFDVYVTCESVCINSGLILGLRPANERRRYKVTPSLIGWAQT